MIEEHENKKLDERREGREERRERTADTG